ncbi:MAG: hypothetical protein ING19_06445 [Azospirillum sp.]|nr:hypothetical protein [Azospirillum sp.]
MRRIHNLVPERLKTTPVEGVWDMTADEVRQILLNGDVADDDAPRLSKTSNGRTVWLETEREYARRVAELVLFIKLRRTVIRDLYPELVFKDPKIPDLELLTKPENILEKPIGIPPMPRCFAAHAGGPNGEMMGRDLIRVFCDRIHEEYVCVRKVSRKDGPDRDKPRFASFSMRFAWMPAYLDVVRKHIGDADEVVKERVKDLGFDLREELEEYKDAAAVRRAEEETAAVSKRAAEAQISQLVGQALREGKVDRRKLTRIFEILSQGDIVSEKSAAEMSNLLTIMRRTSDADMTSTAKYEDPQANGSRGFTTH